MTANMPAIRCLSMFALLFYFCCNNLPSISGGKDSDKFLIAVLFARQFFLYFKKIKGCTPTEQRQNSRIWNK
jgi:hypothetical protein